MHSARPTIHHAQDAAQTLKIAEHLAVSFKGGEVVFINGTMGAGKSVFARGLARGLGIQGPIPSPSFTILNEYEGRLPFFHFDLYRIGDEEELVMLGADYAFHSTSVVAVEWSARALAALPEPSHTVEISIDEPDTRVIRMWA